jgi:hypothetical protein
MVFNTIFNNILFISSRSVILVKETGRPGENHRLVPSHWQTLSHNVVHLLVIKIRTRNISGDRYWLEKLVVNPTTIRSRPRRPLWNGYLFFSKHTALRNNMQWMVGSESRYYVQVGLHVYQRTCFSELTIYKNNSACWSRTKQTSIIIIWLEINLLSPWYSWKLTELTLNNNHSLI